MGCFDCYLDDDGVSGTCPPDQCGLDHSMNDKEWCAFESCGEEIFAVRNDLSAKPSVGSLLNFEASCDVRTLDTACSDGVATAFRCLQEKGCLAQAEECQDPHIELEGCACEGGTAYVTGCHRGDSPETERYCKVANETACAMSLLAHGEDPEVSLVLSARGYRLRNTCCFESSPIWGEGITACPLPDETPNFFMCLGFISLNCIPLVGPLVFLGTSSFWTAWKKIWSRTQKIQDMNSVVSSSAMASSASPSLVKEKAKMDTTDYHP